MKRKYATAIIFSVAAIGFTWVSPYIAMYRISIAAKSVRLENLAQQADLPAVRTMAYRSWNEVVLRRSGAGPAASQFLLRRHGIWNWKLTDITLPPELL